jgi:hypothetical protein
MKAERKLTFVGVMLIVLSMTMATQYATTKVGYSYTIVHPSNADIRFIGSDNSSDGRVLRVDGSNSTKVSLILEFGNWSADSNKTYTAAFGIVNEEMIAVNIMNINVSANGSDPDYLQIWIHGDRDQKIQNDGTSVYMWNNGSSENPDTSVAWTLGAGDRNTSNMTNGTLNIPTPWDTTRHVRYSVNDTSAQNGTSDFVWVQVSLNIPKNPDASASRTGRIWIHFKADAS